MEDNDNRKKATAVAIALFLGVAALGFAIAAMQSDSLLTGDNANDDAAFATVQPGENTSRSRIANRSTTALLRRMRQSSPIASAPRAYMDDIVIRTMRRAPVKNHFSIFIFLQINERFRSHISVSI